MLNREVEKKIRDHDAQLEQNKNRIEEVASTGTTAEVVRNKVEEMAEQGLIQAYALADGTLEPKKTTFFNIPENLYKEGNVTITGTGQWLYKNITINITPKQTYYSFILESVVNCGYTSALRIQFKKADNSIIFDKKLPPSTNKQYVEYFDSNGDASQVFIQLYRSQGANPPLDNTVFSGIALYDIPYGDIKETLKTEFYESGVNDVIEKKVNKVQSRNLIDFENLEQGYYINANGGLTSAQYILPHWYTDYINVESMKNIIRKIKKSTATYLAFYDKDKNFIPNSYYAISGAEFEFVVNVPPDAIYCRFSFGRLDTLLQSGVTIGNCENSKKLYSYSDLEPIKTDIVLPDVINVAKNIDFNMYYDNISNYINPNVYVTSSKGNAYKRFYKYKTATTNSDFSLSISTYDNYLNTISDKRIIVKTIDTSSLVGKTPKILCVGDSFTDIGQWVERLNLNLISSGVTPEFIGTKVGNGINLKREFKSGGILNDFVTGSAVNPWWNKDTQTNDVSKYLTDNSLDVPDILIIQFTWNDLPFYKERDYSYMINDIKTLSSLFKAINQNLKVIFSVEPMGAIEFNNRNTYLKKSAVLNFAQALYNEFNGTGEYSYISICPAYAWVDRINGYDYSNISFDHFTETEKATGDSVHCNKGGMYQIGDSIFSLLSSLLISD